MSGSQQLLLGTGAGGAVAATYIEDVFSTWLYTGNGSTQTITNGIDLSTKGGMVWMKKRSGSDRNHQLVDTERGTTKYIASNLINAQTTNSTRLTAFNTNGFNLGSDAEVNESSATFASWAFRKQAKFFDVVTYTGTGANRTIAHSLGSVPGCILIKCTTSGSYDWQVYHRSLANTEYLVLNTTAAKATGTTVWNSTTPTSTVFSLGTASSVNELGDEYVAYLFAHDAGGFGLTGTDNVISCGSVSAGTTNQTITLGYEPQFVITKSVSAAGAWHIADNLRGMIVASNGFGNEITLAANTSAAEDSVGQGLFSITPTGMRWETQNSTTYIYIAIRRGPMKTPTDATKVFMPTVYTGTNVDNRLVDTTIAPDMVWARQRDNTTISGMVVGDRIRSQPYLLTGSTAAEVDDADAFDKQLISTTEYGTAFTSMNGFWCGNDNTARLNTSTVANNIVAEAFKRAPGFFDVVCYTGTNSGMTISHNLGVTPEIVILKCRNAASSWFFWSNGLTSTNYKMRFNFNEGESDEGTSWISVSSSSVTLTNGYFTTNTNVMYLFATVAGVSKVGTYTGTGSTLQIDCGFTNGARFVLIKRRDNTGDWYVWDSARGIVAGNDPYLLLNSTAAEVTNTDYVDTYSAGFEISSTAPADINENGGTYIFLAIA